MLVGGGKCVNGELDNGDLKVFDLLVNLGKSRRRLHGCIIV